MLNKLKYKSPEEWLMQSNYDIETAEAMFSSKRYIYTVFMIHLSIEKALKGVFAQTFEENPPKTHHLLFLIEKIQSKILFDIPENIFAPIREIDKVSIPVRYPEDLKKLNQDYTEEITFRILSSAREIINWLKSKLNK